jgi:hypothetical protein
VKVCDIGADHGHNGRGDPINETRHRGGGDAATGPDGFRANPHTPARAHRPASPPSIFPEIQLTVRADDALPPNFSDIVEFFLHTIFIPSCIKASFRGYTASVTVHAWGGFTVGAWLPSQRVELECDLAALPLAMPP